MKLLKKILLANNKQPILLPSDSRNDNSLSKIYSNSKTNYSSNSNVKLNYINLKNSENKFNKKKEDEVSKDYISFINADNKTKNKNEKKIILNTHNSKYKYAFNKNFTINNNVINNISNHITNIILSNNSFNLKKNNLNKKINFDEKKIFNNNSISNSIFLNQRINENIKTNKSFNNKINIQNKHYMNINKNYYLIKNGNIDLIKNKNDISSSIKEAILSHKLIAIKDNKNKKILERNGNKLNICFTTSSTNNIKRKAFKSSNIQLIKKKFLKKKNFSNNKNQINSIELDSYKNKLKSFNKNLQDKSESLHAINNINPKIENKFRPSLKYLENTLSLNNIKIKENKNKINIIKKIQSEKNNILNYKCYSTRAANDRNLFKNLKFTNNSFSNLNKIQKQNKSLININNIKNENLTNINKLLYLINNKRESKSYNEKSCNNSFNITSITNRGNLKTNASKIDKTFMQQDTKSKSKNQSKGKNRKFINIKYKNIIKLINNSNYKTERSIYNTNNKNINNNLNNSNINISTVNNNISKKINLSNSKNKSFIKNFKKKSLINNESFKARKKKLSLNMNININKNLKKELFIKSLNKKSEQTNLLYNYISKNYNSYKDQFLANIVKSYKNISYISKEKTEKNTKNSDIKNIYYNNQKKIHERKINKMKKNNRCQKNSIDFSTINFHHNDLVNLVNIKYYKNNDKNKNKIINKELLKPIFKNKRKSPDCIINNNKKNIQKDCLNWGEENKNIEKKDNDKRKKIESIPKYIIKNILNINNNDNLIQVSNIKSARISPNCSNNYLIKNYRNSMYNKNTFLENNKSFKVSMNHIFNIHYNKIKSLDKNKQSINNNIISEIKIVENINIKGSNKNINGKEIKKISEKNLKVYEISDEEKEKEKTNDKENEKEDNNIIIDEKIKNNPQYLGDYLIDILENLLLEESFYIKKKYINPNYLYSNNNIELTPYLRLVSINWIIMIHHKIFKFKEETLFLSVQIIDRFLSKKILNLEQTELLILCSLILASKHEEVDYVNMTESLQLSNNKFTKEQIINMQYEILNELNFEIIIPNANDYFNIFAIILNLTDIEKSKGLYLLNIVLVDYYMLEFPNCILSLAVIKLVIKKTIKFLIEIIKNLLIKNKEDLLYNLLQNENILDTVGDQIKYLYKQFVNTKFKSIEDKFAIKEFNSVSINPNDLFI